MTCYFLLFLRSSLDDIGIDKEVCFFCSKTKYSQGNVLPLKQSKDLRITNFIESAAKHIGDEENLIKIEILKNFKVLPVYHKNCYFSYISPVLKYDSKKKKENEISFKIEFGKHAFKVISEYIELYVLNMNGYLMLDFVVEKYRDALIVIYSKNELVPLKKLYATNHIRAKIACVYGKLIRIYLLKDNVTYVIARKNREEVINMVKETCESTRYNIQSALAMHQLAKKVYYEKLPCHIGYKDIIKGECPILPQEMVHYFETLLSGTGNLDKISPEITRKAEFLTQNVIFDVHRGRVKPSKHLTLGFTVKALSGSRKIIDILNKYGVSPSYHVLEELETRAANSAIKTSAILPPEVVRLANYITVLAFNNFDRFTDSKRNFGQDSLHDTVGIVSQIQLPSVIPDCQDSSGNNELSQNIEVDEKSNTIENISVESIIDLDEINFIVGKRKFVSQQVEKQPFCKKLKMTENLLSLKEHDECFGQMQVNPDEYIYLDLAWMFSHVANIPNTPMWVGFNNEIIIDNSPKQKVFYLQNLNASPTNHSVVKETLNICLKAKEELGKDYIEVTYDLNIACIAMKIQSMYIPQYDSIFVHLGMFHVQMAYFHAIGKFIDNCGLTNLLVDAGILASGSVSGFTAGKHFNRCKRIHPMMALCLRMLLCDRFFSEKSIG